MTIDLARLFQGRGAARRGLTQCLVPLFLVIPLVSLLAGCPADQRPTEETEPPAETERPAAEPEDAPADEPRGRAAAEEAEPGEQAARDAGEADDDYFGPPRAGPSDLVPGDGNLFGVLQTNHGSIVVRFYEDEAPLATANFVGLATGQLRYRNPETGEVEKGAFYDGTIFHRVIPQFMIKGGDPTGTGRGGPGYRFQDEEQDLEFDRPGLLAMANAGPNTNGSQFFITDAPTPHLTGRHTIFGTVEEGMDVVSTIARLPRGPMDRPSEPVVLEEVEIVRASEPPSP